MPRENGETASEALCDQWRSAGQEWIGAVLGTQRFDFVAERPIWFFVEGVGGNRILNMCPMPASQSLRSEASVPTASAAGVSTDMGAARCMGLGNFARRAELPPVLRDRYARAIRVELGTA